MSATAGASSSSSAATRHPSRRRRPRRGAAASASTAAVELADRPGAGAALERPGRPGSVAQAARPVGASVSASRSGPPDPVALDRRGSSATPRPGPAGTAIRPPTMASGSRQQVRGQQAGRARGRARDRPARSPRGAGQRRCPRRSRRASRPCTATPAAARQLDDARGLAQPADARGLHDETSTAPAASDARTAAHGRVTDSSAAMGTSPRGRGAAPGPRRRPPAAMGCSTYSRPKGARLARSAAAAPARRGVPLRSRRSATPGPTAARTRREPRDEQASVRLAAALDLQAAVARSSTSRRASARRPGSAMTRGR